MMFKRMRILCFILFVQMFLLNQSDLVCAESTLELKNSFAKDLSDYKELQARNRNSKDSSGFDEKIYSGNNNILKMSIAHYNEMNGLDFTTLVEDIFDYQPDETTEQISELEHNDFKYFLEYSDNGDVSKMSVDEQVLFVTM